MRPECELVFNSRSLSYLHFSCESLIYRIQQIDFQLCIHFSFLFRGLFAKRYAHPNNFIYTTLLFHSETIWLNFISLSILSSIVLLVGILFDLCAFFLIFFFGKNSSIDYISQAKAELKLAFICYPLKYVANLTNGKRYLQNDVLSFVFVDAFYVSFRIAILMCTLICSL